MNPLVQFDQATAHGSWCQRSTAGQPSTKRMTGPIMSYVQGNEFCVE
jgi:hypothetical protein